MDVKELIDTYKNDTQWNDPQQRSEKLQRWLEMVNQELLATQKKLNSAEKQRDQAVIQLQDLQQTRVPGQTPHQKQAALDIHQSIEDGQVTQKELEQIKETLEAKSRDRDIQLKQLKLGISHLESHITLLAKEYNIAWENLSLYTSELMAASKKVKHLQQENNELKTSLSQTIKDKETMAIQLADHDAYIKSHPEKKVIEMQPSKPNKELHVLQQKQLQLFKIIESLKNENRDLSSQLDSKQQEFNLIEKRLFIEREKQTDKIQVEIDQKNVLKSALTKLLNAHEQLKQTQKTTKIEMTEALNREISKRKRAMKTLQAIKDELKNRTSRSSTNQKTMQERIEQKTNDYKRVKSLLVQSFELLEQRTNTWTQQNATKNTQLKLSMQQQDQLQKENHSLKQKFKVQVNGLMQKQQTYEQTLNKQKVSNQKMRQLLAAIRNKLNQNSKTWAAERVELKNKLQKATQNHNKIKNILSSAFDEGAINNLQSSIKD